MEERFLCVTRCSVFKPVEQEYYQRQKQAQQYACDYRKIEAEIFFFNDDIAGHLAEERNAIPVVDNDPCEQDNATGHYQKFAHIRTKLMHGSQR
jgi:hypothetical protein